LHQSGDENTPTENDQSSFSGNNNTPNHVPALSTAFVFHSQSLRDINVSTQISGPTDFPTTKILYDRLDLIESLIIRRGRFGHGDLYRRPRQVCLDFAYQLFIPVTYSSNDYREHAIDTTASDA
jgi:hypothetical protein